MKDLFFCHQNRNYFLFQCISYFKNIIKIYYINVLNKSNKKERKNKKILIKNQYKINIIKKQITHWVQEYQNEQEIAFIIIVGNKIDLKDQIDVSKEQGEMGAREKGYQHMLCSAKTGEGVNEIFKKLAEGIYHNTDIMNNLPKKNNVTIVAPSQKSGCC